MIYGIGIDVCKHSRLHEMDSERLDRFGKMLMTIREQQEIHWDQLDRVNRVIVLAKRWAAKEAVYKALGRQIPQSRVEVLHEDKGGPYLVFLDAEADKIPRNLEWHISVTDETDFAMAMVIAEEGY